MHYKVWEAKEVKVAEWIRGSSISWTENYDKNLYLTVTIVVMELTFLEGVFKTVVVGLEVTITDER